MKAGLFSGQRENSLFNSKKYAFGQIKKNLTEIHYKAAKIQKKRFPKKPKGIPVFVPNVSKTTFHEYFHFCDFARHSIEEGYYLFLSLANGKRGPPRC